MNIIDKAFEFCMKWEGGSKYTNDPNDSGGPTKYGVALNYDKGYVPDKNGDGKIDAIDIKMLSEEDAKKIYVEKYWYPNKCDKLPEIVAFVYVDMCWNIGPSASPRLLQKALYGMGMNIDIDGVVGSQTLNTVNKVNSRKLVVELTNVRLEYYRSRPKWNIYGRGWKNRTLACMDTALSI